METDISVVVDWIYDRLLVAGGLLLAISLVGAAVVRVQYVLFRRSR